MLDRAFALRRAGLGAHAAALAHLTDRWAPGILNNIMAQLSDVGKGWFNLAETSRDVYQHSKLTRLLQNSLGGNARTLLIVAGSPHEDNFEETISTLEFAKRAREIKCTAKVNKKKNKQAMIPPKVPCEVLEKDLEDSMKVPNDIKALIAEVKQLYKDKKWKVKMSQEYVKKEEGFQDALDNEETIIEQHTGKSTRLQTKQAKGTVKVRKRKGKR